MFGCEAKIGLTFSALHTEVIATMQNEDDLVAALTSSSSQNSTAEAATDNSTDDSTVQIPVPSTSSAVPDRDDDEAAQQTLAYRTTQIRKRRAAAYSGQVAQTERVVKRTRVELKAGVAGDNVAVPIPLVDRGRGDPRNILGVIVNRDLDTDQYTIAVKAGVLHGRYSRNQFDLCPQRLLTLYDVN